MKNNVKKKIAVLGAAFFLAACAKTGDLQSFDAVESENKTSAKKTVRVSDANKNSAEPNIAVAPDNSLYLVWVEHRSGKNADVFLQHLDGDANKIGEKSRVNPIEGQATAWFGDAPSVKVGGDGKIFVGWTTKNAAQQKGNAGDVYLSVSSDGGRTFAAPVKVNDDAQPAAHGMHSLAIGADNRVYVAWLDERNLKIEEKAEKFAAEETDDSLTDGFQFVKIDHKSSGDSNSAEKSTHSEHKEKKQEAAAEPNSEIFYAVSSDGGRTFAANRKLSAEVCPCCKTNLLAARDGRVFVSWRQVVGGAFRHIAVASITDGGDRFTKPVIVSDDRWQINSCPVSGAPMTFGDDGALLRIAWFTAGDAGKPGLYRAESNDGGATFSRRFLAFEGAVAGTPVFLTSGNRTNKIVWESGGQIFQSESTANENDSSRVSDGNLPSGVVAGEKLFVVFIRNEGENRTIHLARVE